MGWKAEKAREKFVVGKTKFNFFQDISPSVEETETIRKALEAEKEKTQAAKAKVNRTEANPELVGSLSKLYWKSNMTIDMYFYSNGHIMSVVPFNTSTHKEMKRIHLDESKIRECLAAYNHNNNMSKQKEVSSSS